MRKKQEEEKEEEMEKEENMLKDKPLWLLFFLRLLNNRKGDGKNERKMRG